jgi:hypothetical protein
MNTFRRILTTTAVAAALTLTAAGCAGDQMGDKPIDAGDIYDADQVRVFRNVDGYPNIAVVCIEGVAFATTSRRRRDLASVQVAQQLGNTLLRSEVYELLEFTPPMGGDDALTPGAPREALP